MNGRERRQTGRIGEAAFKLLCLRAGHKFHAIDGGDDDGIDGVLEVRSESGARHWILVQVKSGKSFRRGGDGYSFRATAAQYERWKSHNALVIGVVWDDDLGAAFWTDITDSLSKNPDLVKRGPYSLPIEKSAVLDFAEVASRAELMRPSSAGVLTVLNGLVAGEIGVATESFLRIANDRSLLSHPAVAYLLVSRWDADGSPSALILEFLSHYLWHPEWTLPVDMGTSWSVHWWLSARLTREQFLLMLRMIDENEFARGSIGQSFLIVMKTAFNPLEELMPIVVTDEIETEVRHRALMASALIAPLKVGRWCVRYAEHLPHPEFSEVVAWSIQLAEEEIDGDEKGLAWLYAEDNTPDPRQLLLWPPSDEPELDPNKRRHEPVVGRTWR